ncbi:unnamed protein product [Linum tenue]|uniref:Uncharacterized protein n=1 Tax=Linum tenue TaxID=586396 RepID=A0AAV0Q671_9ROSI|nr:unnamed protein product [Linum tenue]
MDSVDKSADALDFVGGGELAANAASASRRSMENVGVGNGKLEANGSFSNVVTGSETSSNIDDIAFRNGGVTEEGFGSKQVGSSSNSSPRLSVSPAAGTSPTMKGYGLKKWRRIRRDMIKDGSGGMDSGKAMKRGLSGSGNPVRPVNLASPMGDKLSNEGFIGSVHGNGVPGSSLDSRFAVGSAFAAGADSENSISEDRSSKSSTAASAPRARNDLAGGSGYGWEKNRTKPLNAKVAVISAQRGQLGKGHVESSKKARGERAMIEKENSQSSMESDSRSSNFVFTQGLYSVTSNGKQSETSLNDDGENSYDAHAGEHQGSVEFHTGYDHETVEEVGYHSQDGSAVDASSQNKDEKIENNHPLKAKDPLVESMFMLQSVQEALESEIQKLGEIGKISSNPTDPPQTDPEVSSSPFARFEAATVAMLSENVKHLESRLKEALAMLCAKEARVAELEDTLQRSRSNSQRTSTDEMELEAIFKQKLEAEVQCLALTKTLQHSTRGEMEALIGEQEQMVQKFKQVESNAEAVKRGVEVLAAEKEGKEIRQGLRKAASCFFIQLMLLILVVWFVVSQLSPHSGASVPT